MADMSPQDKVTSVVKSGDDSLSRVKGMLDKASTELEKALPDGGMMAEQFGRILLTTLRGSPQLARCAPSSILRSAFESASLGLPIDGVLGHAYIVPYKVRGNWQAQLQVGYRGLLELAYRSGKIARITAGVICEHDLFEYEDGSEAFLRHQKMLTGDRGVRIGAYALAETILKGTIFVVLREDDIYEHRASSASYKFKPSDSPWTTHPEAMWRKTAIRALAALLPQSPEMQRAAVGDEARDTGRAPRAQLSANVIEYGDAGAESEREPGVEG